MEKRLLLLNSVLAFSSAFLQYIKVPTPIAWACVSFFVTAAIICALPNVLTPTIPQACIYEIGVALIVAAFVWQLTSISDQNLDRASITKNRKHELDRLTRLYILSHDGITPRMVAGLELPPADFLNAELERSHANWRVKEVDGAAAQTYDLKP